MAFLLPNIRYLRYRNLEMGVKAVNAERSKFDFDEWRTLFETNPERFEEQRREAIESVIAVASEQQQKRLRGLQWRIDTVRGQHKHPIASTTKIFRMMWDKVYGENGLQEVLTNPQVSRNKPEAGMENVLTLRRAEN